VNTIVGVVVLGIAMLAQVAPVLATVTVAPLSTGSHPYPYRVPCAWRGMRGHVIVDQICTLDRARIDRIAGAMSSETVRRVLATLREMFEE